MQHEYITAAAEATIMMRQKPAELISTLTDGRFPLENLRHAGMELIAGYLYINWLGINDTTLNDIRCVDLKKIH